MKTNTNQELDVAEQLRHQYFCLSQVNQAILALEEVLRLREDRLARHAGDPRNERLNSRMRLPEERIRKRSWQFVPMVPGSSIRFPASRRVQLSSGN